MCPTNESEEDLTCDFSSVEELTKLDLSYNRRISARQPETTSTLTRLKSSKSTNMGQSKLLQRRLYESPPKRKNTVGGGIGISGPNVTTSQHAYENMQVETKTMEPRSKVNSRFLGDLNYR